MVGHLNFEGEVKHVQNIYHAMNTNNEYKQVKVKMKNVGSRPGRILAELAGKSWPN